MNALAQQLLAVCKRYLGPAAGPFLHSELAAFGTDANRIEVAQIDAFADAVLRKAEQLMGPGKAAEFRGALLACAAAPAKPAGGEHRLATDAAANLLQRGRAKEAAKAYAELAGKHGDLDSYRGLSDALVLAGDREGAVRALRDGASARLHLQDRAGELELLSHAVVIAPTDLAAHRRLAAALANHGDLAGSCAEYRRYVDAVLAQGDTRRALLEITYGREILGELPELLALVDHIARYSAPGAARPVDEARSSAPNPAAGEPIDFTRAAALRRRLHDGPVTGAAAASGVEGALAALVVQGTAPQAAAIAHMRATLLLGARDPRARDAVLDAAKRLLAVEQPRAATDILLAYVNGGEDTLDAHLLLGEAVRRLGRSDIAEEKYRLVGLLARLARNDQAARAADSALSASSAMRRSAPLVAAAGDQRAVPSRTA